MNAFERAIHAYCGLVIEGIPADGKMRKFKIGQQDGYAIYFGDCGSFGNWSRQELFQWDGKKSRQIEITITPAVYRGRALQAEQQIVAKGNLAQDRGEKISDADLDRYIFALGKVIEAKQYADSV